MCTFKLTKLLMVISISILITFYIVLNNQVLKQPYRRYKKSSEIIRLYKNSQNIIFYKNISNTVFYPTSHNYVSNNSKSTKLIIVWTPLFGDREWGISFKRCAIHDCVISSNSSLLLQSDAVLFHARDLLVTDLPRQRNPQQKWIFYSLESPHYSYFSGFGVLNGVFNWTMTYRLDSDVVVRYGDILPADSRSGGITKELWKRKKRSVIWMVSHCETASKRETYVDELQKYIDVDIFGRCGNIICPSDRTSDCLRSFSYMYKFYLSFENSICKDYVTEKLYTILNYDMIPIVLGGANYESLAPPISYIDALNFTSPKQLADYLYKVGNNYTLYKSYMDWKSTYRSNVDLNHCDLCAKLHTDLHTTTIKKDLKFWWVDEAQCRNWKQ